MFTIYQEIHYFEVSLYLVTLVQSHSFIKIFPLLIQFWVKCFETNLLFYRCQKYHSNYFSAFCYLYQIWENLFGKCKPNLIKELIWKMHLSKKLVLIILSHCWAEKFSYKTKIIEFSHNRFFFNGLLIFLDIFSKPLLSHSQAGADDKNFQKSVLCLILEFLF